ncbi:MAG: thioredoxin family protein [Bdellovibrionaceae bacterium]|nr:thioredoxin family protein [Pseudobdellovibrionaceae bacterium]
MLCRSFLLLGTFLLSSVAFSKVIKQPHIEVELVADAQNYIAGEAINVGVRYKTDPHWHIYWLNPGDSGEPAQIDWNVPETASVGSNQWPQPKRIAVGALTNYGYEGETLVATELRADTGSTGPMAVEATTKWLVCNEECIPGKATLSLLLPAGKSGTSSKWKSLFDKTRSQLPTPWDSQPLRVAHAGKEVRLDFNSPMAPTDFFPLQEGIFLNTPAPTIQSSGESHRVVLSLKEENTVPQKVDGLLVFADGSAKSISQAVSAPRSEASLLSMLLFALIGGFLLNLMPCVFPVLSIKVLGFFEQSRADKTHAAAHSVSYLFGILVSFWLLVAGLLIVRAGGTHIGWGFQLQSPIFLASLSFIFVAVGMNLLGAYDVGGSFMGVGQNLSQKSGVAGSFFTGVLATLVATPCTAPFMGVAIGFALSQPGWVTFLVFTAIGVGMASPYVILAAFPKLIAYLPKPGAWMETFRQFLAFPIFLTVLWILSVIGEQTDPHRLFVLRISLLVFAMGLWAYGKTGWRKWQVIFAVVFVGAGLAVGLRDLKPSPKVQIAEGEWQTFSEERLAELQAANVPIFIDFTASWCITCQVNKQAVLDTQPILDKFKEKGVALLLADWTNQDEVISKRLESFGRNGVPLYVFYSGKAGSEPVLLPQILTKETVLKALDSI